MMRSLDSDRSSCEKISRMRAYIADRRWLVFGRHSKVSAWLWFVSLVSTIVIAGTVALTTIRYTPTGPVAGRRIVLHSPSYTQLWEWFSFPFDGNTLHPIYVVGAIVLLVGAAVSAYLNGGLLPTAGLVMGPIFGLFVNRIGTPMLVKAPTEPGFSYTPMPLFDAIVWGVESALFLGIPIVIVGFTTGIILRSIVPPRRMLSA